MVGLKILIFSKNANLIIFDYFEFIVNNSKTLTLDSKNENK